MVTGVETAGLVLAAFPIVAGGLGSYIAGCNILIRWRNQRKYGRELRTFQRQLETQKVIYLNTLEDLIGGIVCSDADKSLLINEPGGPAWRRPEYDTRLRERLGQSYQAYVGTMTDLLESMTFLRERMNQNRPEVVRFPLALILNRYRASQRTTRSVASHVLTMLPAFEETRVLYQKRARKFQNGLTRKHI